MNKLMIKLYQLLTILVVISMSISTVGPAYALNVSIDSSNSTPKTSSETPYDPYINTTSLISGAPLSPASMADLSETDPFAMLQMSNVPVPYTPQESNSPFGALNLLNDLAKAPGRVNPQAQIMAQAKAQSAKADEFSTETATPTEDVIELDTVTPTDLITETPTPEIPVSTETLTSTTTTAVATKTPTATTDASTETPTATIDVATETPTVTPTISEAPLATASPQKIKISANNNPSALLLAPAISKHTSAKAAGIFYQNTVFFTYDGVTPVVIYPVSGNELCTDDGVVIKIVHPNGTLGSYSLDYSKAGPGITCTGPIDLTDQFQVGKNKITIQLWDMIAPNYGSNGYQIGEGAIDDTTPPLLEIVEVWPDGRGNLSIKVHATDPESGISSVVISGNGIKNAPMTFLGNGLYGYAFKNVGNKIFRFTVTAKNGVGLSTTVQGDTRSPKYFDYSAWLASQKCECGVGDPILPGSANFIYTLPVMFLPGPGESSIVFALNYANQNPRVGAYGQGWTAPYQLSLDFRDNLLLKGIDITYPDGRLVLFEDQGDGTYKAVSPGVFDKIEKRGDSYVLITLQQTEYEFNATGQLTVIRDANGNPIRLSYTGDQLTRIENDGGRWINLTYTDGKVSALDGPENKHVEFDYTGPALTSFKDLNGQIWKYDYQTKDQGTLVDVDGEPYQAIDYWLREIKTPKGHVITKNIYNDKGEITDQWVGGREHRQFVRDENTHITLLTDAYGKQTKFTYDDQSRLIRIDYSDDSYEAFDYDNDFNRIYLRDRNGKEWHYGYDTKGNMTSEDGPMGSHRAWKYHNTFNKPIRAEEKLADGKVSVWTFEYNDKGNLKTICNPYNCGGMTYNERGETLTVTDFAGNVTTNSYEPDWDLESTRNGEDETTTFGTDGAGRIVRITSPLHKTFTFTFDPSDKLTDVNGPMGYHTSTSYDPNGNVDTQTDANNGDTVYRFDTAEKLTSIKNQNGVTIASYAYGEMSEVKSFTDGEGRLWTYDNDSDQRMIGMHGPLGVNITFERDAVGNIKDMTDAEGRITHTDYDDLYRPITVIENVQKGKDAKAPDANNTTVYKYDLAGNLVQMIDPASNVTVFDYDLLSRIVYLRDAQNQETKWEYTELDNLKKLTNPRGKVISFTYDKANRKLTFTNQLNFVTRYAYDDDSHLSDIIDGSDLHVVTHYDYNDLGRMTAEIRNYKLGGPQNSQTNVTTAYAYDFAGNLKTITAPRGEVATYNYDPAFRLKEVVDFAGGHTKYEYDNVNNLLKVTDGNGYETKYDVDDLNRVTSITNPELHTVKFKFNKTGAMTDLWDAMGNHTHFTLDRLDRVTVMLDAMNGIWRYDYDRVGNILFETDANTHVTSLIYDKVYRLLTSTDAENNVTKYDWDENGNLKTLTDGNKHVTGFVYDDADQLISSTNAENETTQYKYNALGYQSKLIEADNTVTAYGYDQLYRLSQVTENEKPGGPSNNDTNVITRYVYDKNSNLEQFINAKGAITKFEHDGMGRITKETNPLNSVWQYKYDPVGNLTQRIDAKDKLTQYWYYPDNKPQQIGYFDGTTIKFEYDKNNNMTNMQDKLGTSTWHYDALNHVKDTSDSLGRTLAFGYDPVGNRLNMTYPDGKTVKYTYYDNNWIKSMTSPGGTTSYTPDHVGNITNISNPNATETVISYDNVNRTKKLLNQQLTGAAKINSAFTYTYNKVGHVTNVVSTYASQGETALNGHKVGWQKRTDINESYGYDGLHRLASATRSGNIVINGKPSHIGWKMAYEYDKVGNRTKWTTDDNPFTNNPKDNFTTTYTYNAANQLTQTKVVAKQRPDNVTIDYSYDQNGNRINKLETPLSGVKRGTAYAYDPENRLVTVQDYQKNGVGNRINRAVTNLAYDGLGRRLVQTYDPKTGNGGAKRVEYTFDGLDPVVETQMWNKQYDNYYRGALGRISVRQHFPTGTDGQFMWYDYNFKGDVSGLSKQSGQSIHNYQYDPYGGVIPQTGNFTDPHNDYTLTGKEYDNNTGLIYFGARHYDPQSSQWMTQDSYRGETSQPATLSRYAYLISNPVNYVDLYGFKTVVFVQGIDGGWNGINLLNPDNGKESTTKWDTKQIYQDATAAGYTPFFFCYQGTSGPNPNCTGKPNTASSKAAAAKLYQEIENLALRDPNIIIVSHSKGSNVVKYMLSHCVVSESVKEWYSYNGATEDNFYAGSKTESFNGNPVFTIHPITYCDSAPYYGYIGPIQCHTTSPIDVFDPKKLQLETHMTILGANERIRQYQIRRVGDPTTPEDKSKIDCSTDKNCYLYMRPTAGINPATNHEINDLPHAASVCTTQQPVGINPSDPTKSLTSVGIEAKCTVTPMPAPIPLPGGGSGYSH